VPLLVRAALLTRLLPLKAMPEPALTAMVAADPDDPTLSTPAPEMAAGVTGAPWVASRISDAVALLAVEKAALTRIAPPLVKRSTGPVGPPRAMAPPIVMLPVWLEPPIVRRPEVEIAFKSAARRLRSPPTVAPRLMGRVEVNGSMVTVAVPAVRPPVRFIVSPERLTAFAEPPLLTAPEKARRLLPEERVIVPLLVTEARVRFAAVAAMERLPAVGTVTDPVKPLPEFASVAEAAPVVRLVVPPMVRMVTACCVSVPE